MEHGQHSNHSPRAAQPEEVAVRLDKVRDSSDSIAAVRSVSWPIRFLNPLRHRAIKVHTLPRWLRMLCWLAIGQLLLVGLLVSLHDVSQPQLIVDTPTGGAVEVPFVIFTVSLIALVLGWSVLLAAAFHSPWPLRLLALGAFTLVFGGKPTVALITQYPQLDPALQLLAWVETALIGIVWGIGLGLWLPDVLVDQRPRSVETRSMPWRSFCVILAILLMYYAVAAWYAFLVGAPHYVAFFPKMVTAPLGLASILLIFLPFLAATDYAEFGSRMSEHVAGLLRRIGATWLLFAVTTLVALGVVIRVLIETRPNSPHGASLSLGEYLAGFVVVLVFGAIIAVLAAGLLFLLMRLGRTKQWLEVEIPQVALIAALLLVVLGVIFMLVAGPAALVVVALGGSLVLGISLLVRGRRKASTAAVTGLFLILFALFSLTGNVIHMIAGPASLVVLLYLALRHQVNQETTTLISLLFTLNGGLLILSWIDAAYGSRQYQAISTAAQRFTPIQALLIVGALLWSFMMSGRTFFTEDGPMWRRDMRVVLYVGYLILASTSAMYFAAETTTASSTPQQTLGGISDGIAFLGITILGIPFLLTSFVLGVSRWRGQRQRPVAAPPALDAVLLSEGSLPPPAGASAAIQATSRVGPTAPAGGMVESAARLRHASEHHGVIWRYGAVGGGILALLNLLSMAYPAGEVAFHHGTTTEAIGTDYVAVTMVMFFLSLIVYWNVGRAAARKLSGVGPGIGAALVSGGLGGGIFIVGNILIAIPQQHPLFNVAGSGSASLNGVSAALLAVVVWVVLAVALLVQSVGTAALVGYLGARSGKKVAEREARPSA